jgi:hypothetical protein
MVTAIGLGLAATSPASAEVLYYTESGFDDGIRKLNTDGTGHDFAFNMAGQADPRGLAVDRVNDRFYYSRGGSIYRSNLDGSDEAFLYDSGSTVPTDVEIDLVAGKVYWGGNGGIRRGDLDGSGAAEILVTQAILTPLYADAVAPLTPLVRADDVNGIELHGGRLYWSNASGLNSMPLTGVAASTDPTNHFTLTGGGVDKIDFDHDEGIVYFTDTTGSKVFRAGLDGSALTTLSARGFGRPTGIAVDFDRGDVFFGDALGTGGQGEILRVNADGTTPTASPEIIFSFASTLYLPQDLEFGTVPEPGSVTILTLAVVGLAARRRPRRDRPGSCAVKG